MRVLAPCWREDRVGGASPGRCPGGSRQGQGLARCGPSPGNWFLAQDQGRDPGGRRRNGLLAPTRRCLVCVCAWVGVSVLNSLFPLVWLRDAGVPKARAAAATPARQPCIWRCTHAPGNAHKTRVHPRDSRQKSTCGGGCVCSSAKVFSTLWSLRFTLQEKKGRIFFLIPQARKSTGFWQWPPPWGPGDGGVRIAQGTQGSMDSEGEASLSFPSLSLSLPRTLGPQAL